LEIDTENTAIQHTSQNTLCDCVLRFRPETNIII